MADKATRALCTLQKFPRLRDEPSDTLDFARSASGGQSVFASFSQLLKRDYLWRRG
jgi:hypothetical protein